MSADGKTHSENNLNDDKASESLLEDKEIKHDSKLETKMFVPDKKYIKHRYFFSGSLASGFLVFGFAISSLGVSIPTFADNLRLSIHYLSPIVVARGFGYLFGSLTAGILEKFIHSYFLVLISLAFIVVGIILTPIVLNLYALFVFNVVTAFGMSAYETISNVTVLRMWGAKSEPVIQFLHFWYTVGGAVINFIMEPFLNEVDSKLNHTTNTTLNESVFPEIKVIENTNIPLVAIPYFMIGVLALLIILFIVATIPSSFLNKSMSQQRDTSQNEGLRFRFIMLAFLFFLYFFYIGFEITLSTYLYIFGTSNAPGMSLSKDFGVYLNSVYLFSYVVGQFMAIFMSRKFAPTVIITVDIIGVVVAGITMILLPLYGDNAPFLFWIAIGVTGLFGASIYGTTFLWAERYITVNASAASTLIVGGALGEMVLPLPVGYLIESNPVTFLYIYFGYVMATTLTFLSMWKYASSKGERVRVVEPNSEDKETIT